MVEAYTENHSDRVKERIIGIEVFQREADYDTNHDSVVRTTAAEIRKKLAQYYQEPGHEDEIRVMLPQGSYLPEFRLSPAVAAARGAGSYGRRAHRRLERDAAALHRDGDRAGCDGGRGDWASTCIRAVA